MEILDYEILVQEHKPPIGKTYSYYAVLQFVSIRTDENHKKIYPDLGETNGKTQSEARDKMEQLYSEWLAGNQTLQT